MEYRERLTGRDAVLDGIWKLLIAFVAVGIGVGVAYLVYRDGVYGHRMQIKALGPNPPLVNDMTHVYSTMGCLVGIGICFVLATLRKHGIVDRVVLALLVLGVFGAAIPYIYQGSLFVVGVLLLARGVRHGDIPFTFSATIFPIGIILISYATTLIYAGKIGSVLPNMFFRSTYIALVLVLPVIIRTRRHLDILLNYVLIMAVMSAIFAIAQFFLSFAAGNPVSFAPSNAAKTTTPFGPVARATGLMLHPNHCAQTLSSISVLMAFFGTKPKGTISPARRKLYLLSAFLCACGTFFTFSRSGWLSLGICYSILPMVRWPKIIPYYLLFGATFVAVMVETGIAEFMYTTVKNFNASSVDFRWMEDQVAIQGFFASPLIGQGVQGTTKFFNAFNLQVHNSYLQILAEMGLFGVTAFAFMFFWMSGRLVERLMHATNRYERDWLIGLCFCLGITMVQGFFTLFLWIRYTWFIMALLETVIQVSKHQATEAEPDDQIFLPQDPYPVFHPAPARVHGT